jgi:hypothetical protein
VGAPLIDPKPILDSWVQLESSLAYRATGRRRFPAASPATGLAAKPSRPGVKPPHPSAASAAGALESSLTPGQWLQLAARLGAIPDPAVPGGHSPAAIPDHPASAAPEQEQGSGVHN